MANHFEALADTWRKTVFAPKGSDRKEAALPDLISRLRAFEKKQLIINLVKTALVAALLFFQCWMILKGNLKTPLMNAGLITIVVCTLVFMLLYWSMQFRTESLNIHVSLSVFIAEAKNKIIRQKKLFSVYFPIFALILIIGANILVFDLEDSTDLVQRILHQLQVTVPLFIVAFMALKIRKYKFKMEFQPVIDHLDSIAKDFLTAGSRGEKEPSEKKKNGDGI